MTFIAQLETVFQQKANPENAFPMAKYMKNHFVFYGIKTTERRQKFQEIWKANKTEVSKNARAIALELYAKEQRELHYCAIEMLTKGTQRKIQKRRHSTH